MNDSFRFPWFVLLWVLLLPNALWAQAGSPSPVRWKIELSEENGRLYLVFRANVEGGWHLYDMDLPAGGPVSTEFHFEKTENVRLGTAMERRVDPVQVHDATFNMDIRQYNGHAVFVREMVPEGSPILVEGYLSYMACNDVSCLPPTSVDFRLTDKDLPQGWKIASDAAPSQADSAVPLPEESEPEVSEAVPAALSGHPEWWRPMRLDPTASNGHPRREDNGRLFLLGFLGGLLALLTPCVWPIIPMTVSFFLKRNRERRHAVREAVLYGISIVVIYLTLGLAITLIFGASALNQLATSALFNILFFLVLVAFAMSFFGWFDIVLPSSWSNAMDRRADRTSGWMSIFFMAFTLVLVSFSCTGPIIGTLLVEAASRGSLVGPAVGMLGFALALALPFGFFALFPQLMRSLPQGGGWLQRVKVVLGFLELAFSLKFLSVADMAYGWGILPRDLFVLLWMALSIACGLYLLGLIRFPHDELSEKLSWLRKGLAICAFLFAIYLIPGLVGAPLRSISAFAPPMSTQHIRLIDRNIEPDFLRYEDGLEAAARQGKPVLLDFSGYGCVNCRKMENAVWTDPRVRRMISERFVLISLMVDDKTPLPEPVWIEEAGQRRKLRTVGDKWSYLQRYKFGANAQPFYVIVSPEGEALSGSYSYNDRVSDFLDFLKDVH